MIEEEEEEEERKKLQGKNIMAPLLHRAAITNYHNFGGTATPLVLSSACRRNMGPAYSGSSDKWAGTVHTEQPTELPTIHTYRNKETTTQHLLRWPTVAWRQLKIKSNTVHPFRGRIRAPV